MRQGVRVKLALNKTHYRADDAAIRLVTDWDYRLRSFHPDMFHASGKIRLMLSH